MSHWTVHVKRGPAACSFYVAVVVRHEVYSFRNDSDHIGVDIFNTVSLRWTKLPPGTTARGERPLEVPSIRLYYTAVLIEDVIYVWGGYPYCNVLYAFDVDTHGWFKPRVSASVPEARAGHSACVVGKLMYIYGGFKLMLTGCTNDIYKLDTATMVWSLINSRGTPTVASLFQSATIIGTKMFVYGIRGYQDYYNNIKVFDIVTDRWLSVPSSAQLLAEGRRPSAFVYNGELYIFGSKSPDQTFCDLWRLNPETFSLRKVEPTGKGPSRMSFMCCCMVGDRIVFFGGYNGSTLVDDLYVLDLSPSLKTLCKLAVIQCGLGQSELPHDIRWELAAMTN